MGTLALPTNLSKPPPDQPRERIPLRRWLFIFVAADAALIVVLLFALSASTGFEGLGLGTDGLIAIILGSTGTASLTILLMALMFHSDRSGHDERVQDATRAFVGPESDSDPRGADRG